MKLMKSLLLGTAAGFAAVAGAQAADLPMRKAAPVEYVRVCSLGGGVFVGYVVPGTDVCLRVGGFVRYEYDWNTPNGRTLFIPGVGAFGSRGYYSQTSGQSATASLQLDARTQTEFGLLRSFADMRIAQGYNQGPGVTGNAYIDKAWVQLGGFQAGKYQSYYDFYADAFNNIGQLGSDHSAIGAAYTFIFGNFSAAISLEDASQNYGNAAYFGEFSSLASVYDPNFVTTPGGYRVPDAVARLLYADTWGQVQLSGVIHQSRANVTGTGAGGINPLTGLAYSSDETKYGWAVQGGVKINVPTFGPSDALYLQAAYAQGAMQYIGATGTYGFGRARELSFASDYSVNPVTGQVKLGDGWNAMAAFQHSWTPSISTALWGSYTAVNYSKSDAILGGFVYSNLMQDYHYWQLGAQANWSPVKNLTISGTVNYINLEGKNNYAFAVLPAGTLGYKKSSDGVGVAIRVQRDF